MSKHTYKVITKMLPQIIFVLGAPGSGKGTQCEKIAKKFGFLHLSAGELLREEVKREDSPYKKVFEEATITGKLVPAEITTGLLRTAMEQSENNKFIIDGFPRNLDNLNVWNKEMADKVMLLFVLSFNCTEEICVKRCMGRQRMDDNENILKKRFISHKNDTKAVLQYYSKENYVRDIDATQNPERMFEKISKLLKEIDMY